jgi:hypothetical protein
MRKIVSLLPIEDYQLKLKFEDGTEKKFDVSLILSFLFF